MGWCLDEDIIAVLPERAEGQADYDAFVASLRKRADIEINEKNLERKAGAATRRRR